MKRKIFLIICIFYFLVNNIISADEKIIAYFEEGNKYYRNGEYDSALIIYNKIIESGFKNPDVFYNIGNCYNNSGKIGKALLFYYRANRLNPSDKDIIENIKYLNTRIKNKRPYEVDLISYSLNFITYLFICSSLLFFILLSVILFLEPQLFKTILIYLTVILFFINIGLGIWLYLRYEYEIINKKGVIIEEKVDVMSGPGPTFLKNTELYEGLDVDIIEERYDYYRVKVFGKEIGWIEKKAIEII